MKIKVISFNILCVDSTENYLISDRAPRLKAVIAPFDPDVIGIQEYRDPWEPHFKEQFPEYEMVNAWRSDDSHRESGPILYKRDKFELVKTGHFWFSDTPEVMSGSEWDEAFHCNRICLYVVLREKESGKEFAFMNTHFGFGDGGQVKSVKLLASYAEKLAPLPIFVTGDFNAFPNSPAYAELIKHFTDVNAVTAKDDGNTYHGFGKVTKKEGPIDYCFITDKVKPISFRVIRELVDGFFPSDHYGLQIELELL